MTILTEAKEVLDPLCHTSPDEFRRIIKELIPIVEAAQMREAWDSAKLSKTYGIGLGHHSDDVSNRSQYKSCLPWDLK